MKKTRLLAAALLASSVFLGARAQLNVGSTAAPVPSAQLQVSGTTKGFLPPVVTSAQMYAIASPATGLQVYCTDCSPATLYFYSGTVWQYVSAVTPAATFTASTINCTGTLAGTYASGTAMTSSNTKTVSITVATPGTYTASTDAQDGVSFAASGILASTGAAAITLLASGTPTAVGTFTYTVSVGGQTCTFSVTYITCQNDVSVGTGTIVQMIYDNTGSGTANYVWCARTVTGPDGLTWLDRNLGAYQVATSSSDAASYGSLYQWGRNADGHQIAGGARGADATTASTTTTTLATTDVPGTKTFITVGAAPVDWRSDNNNNRWNSVTGSGASLVQANNPCPSGYHVPTNAQEVTLSAGWTNAASAFASTLKLPVAGYRFQLNGVLLDVGLYGHYWSSTPNSTSAYRLYFTSSSISPSLNGNRAVGYSVRCVQN